MAAAQRSCLFSPLIDGGVLLNDAAVTSSIKALIARGMRHCGEGEPQEAWRDLVACHRLVGLGHSVCTFEEYACYTNVTKHLYLADLAFARQADLQPTQIAAILDDLEDLPHNAAVRRIAACSQRLVVLWSILQDPYVEVHGDRCRLRNEEVERALVVANKYMDRINEALEESDYRKRIDAVSAIEREYSELQVAAVHDTSDRALTRFLASRPVMISFYLKREAEWLAFLSLVKTVFALERYRLEHGTYPDALERLSPQYVSRMPSDPFSGKPLKYHHTEGGYVLYSVGEDGAATSVVDGQMAAHTGDDIVIEPARR